MMDGLKDLKWPPAVVMVAGFATVFCLVRWGGQKLTDVSLFIGAVSTLYIAWRQATAAKTADRIETNTNGTMKAMQETLAAKDAQLLELQAQHTSQLAQVLAQMPANVTLPKTLTEDQSAK